MIISWSDSRTHYSETYAKNNVNYLWKKMSLICNSMFSLMVHAIDFALGMSNISLACFVKVVSYFSRYSLFQPCNIWIVCSLSLTLWKKPLFFTLPLKTLSKQFSSFRETFSKILQTFFTVFQKLNLNFVMCSRQLVRNVKIRLQTYHSDHAVCGYYILLGFRSISGN